MRVLYFHQYFNTPSSAGGTRSYEMARALIAAGHQVTMVCSSQERQELDLPGSRDDFVRRGTIDGIDVIQLNLRYSNYLSLPQRSLLFLRFALHSVWIALTHDYDLIFATSTPLTAGIPGIFARVFRGKPFVFEVRDLWPELPRAMGVVTNPLVLFGMACLETISYRMASACVALSPGIAEGIRKKAGPIKPLRVIPNGADLDRFVPGRRSELDLPGIGPDDFVAVFTGAHGIANGLDAVLDAATVLQRKGRTDIVFAFIGDGKLKPHLIQRTKDEGLGNCRFFDPIPKQRLAQVIRSCNAGLMILDDVPAFYYGTSPNKFFDYLASGLPIVNNYPGWLAEMIKESDCGIAVPPRDPTALAQALEVLADSPARCRQCAANARRLAEARFAREHQADGFVDFLVRTAACGQDFA